MSLTYFVVLSQLFSLVLGMIPLEVYSNRFIRPAVSEREDGEVFFLKGVDYQPGGSSGYEEGGDSDVLSDVEACYRDAYAFQQMGVNTIRVYTVNPSVNHDECMSVLNDAGIYVILDLGSSVYSIYRDNTADSYNYNTLNRFFNVIDAFKNYPNVLGVFVGNEVINDQSSAQEAPRYLRAFQRDVKLYIQHQSNRTIPVGYSAADVTELRQATWEYLQCNIDGEVDNSKSDFFGLNSYEWCSGINDWSSSGYDQVNSTFYNSTIPVFFSEYGCNTQTPRTFEEVSGGLYDGLINSLSGGLVYEYTEETSNYGLVEIDDSDNSITYKQDLINLESQFDDVTLPNITESQVFNQSIVTCNATRIRSMYQHFGANFTLPRTPDNIMDMILYGVNNSNIGELVEVNSRATNYTIFDQNDDEIDDPIVTFNAENLINAVDGTSTSISTVRSSSTSTRASSTTSTSSSSHAAGNALIPASTGFGLLSLLVSILL